MPAASNKPQQSDPVNLDHPDAPRILQLQPAIGNQAVQRLFGGKGFGLGSNKPKSASGDLMSYAQFQKATGQIGSKGVSEQRRALLSGKAGATYLDEKRKGYGVTQYDFKVDINQAFEKYEANPADLKLLIALHTAVTYWKTMYHGMKGTEVVEPVLNTLMAQVKAKVQAETERQWKETGADEKSAGGLSPEKLANKILGGVKGLAKGYGDPMPGFMREVGVPIGYFDEHIAGNTALVNAFQEFYTELKAGQTYKATLAFRQVEHLPASAFIKSLFVAHFPNQARLDKLVGTDDQAGKGELTPEEINAIKVYSSQAYKEMNSQMRGHDMKSAIRIGERQTEKFIEGGEVRERKKRTQADEDYSRRNMMRLVVSGLNKLPKYQGIAYRTVAKTPANFFQTVRRGATTADIGFSSASSSYEGARRFMSTAGSHHTIFVIHAKTPANIVAMSHSPQEGEVLFRPGTRFIVNEIWEAINGKVPPKAPVEVQMVLHDQYSTLYGYNKIVDDAVFHDDGSVTPARADKIRVVEVTEV